MNNDIQEKSFKGFDSVFLSHPIGRQGKTFFSSPVCMTFFG